MALKNVLIHTIFDGTKSQWINQAPLVTSAIVIAIRKLSGLNDITARQLGATPVDASGRATNVKTQLQWPAGADQADSFMRGSRVGHALLLPEFKSSVNKTIEMMSGQPSAILDIEPALIKSLEIEAPGLIIATPEPSPIVPLDFVLTTTGAFDFYNVVPKADIGLNADAQINYTETPHINEQQAGTVHAHLNAFFGPQSQVDLLKGSWLYKTKEILSDDAATPTLTTFDTEINAGPNPPTITLLKNGVVLSPALFLSGTYVRPTNMEHQTHVIVGLFNFLSMYNQVDDGINSGRYTKTYLERTTLYKKYNSISSSLKINNNTGSVIPMGTVLGRVAIRKDTLETVF